MNIEAVTIFRTWVDVADTLPSDEARGRLYHAICRYALYGEEPQLDGALNAYFTLMRPSIDKSTKRRAAVDKYQQKRQQNAQHANQQNNQQNGDTPTPAAKKEKPQSFVDQLPDHLQTPAFREKWKEWEKYRRTVVRKAISPTAFRSMKTLLDKLDETQAIEAITTSIANDWRGIFPPKKTAQGKSSTPPRKDHSGI